MELDKLQEQLNQVDPLDQTVLRGIAACYEGLGNMRGLFVVYQNLHQNYPDSEHRPIIVYQCNAGRLGDR